MTMIETLAPIVIVLGLPTIGFVVISACQIFEEAHVCTS